MFTAVYDPNTGRLESTGTLVDKAAVEEQGLATKDFDFDIFEINETKKWDDGSATFVEYTRPSPGISRLEFMRRFTREERIAIRKSKDDVVIDFRELLAAAQTVYFDDEETIAGVRYLETEKLIADGRAEEILNG